MSKKLLLLYRYNNPIYNKYNNIRHIRKNETQKQWVACNSSVKISRTT